MDNKEKKDYRKIIITILLVFLIVIFAVIIIYELKKQDFNDSYKQSTETNREWYQDDEKTTSKEDVIKNHSSEDIDDLIKETETEPETEVNAQNKDAIISTETEDYEITDSTAIRPWFKVTGIPNETLTKIDINKVSQLMQKTLYAHAFCDYKEAKYCEEYDEPGYKEMWFTVECTREGKPYEVDLQILCYENGDVICRWYL